MRRLVIFLLVVGAAYWVYKNPDESRMKVGQATRAAGTYIYNLSNKLLAHESDAKPASFVNSEPALQDLPSDVFVLKESVPNMSSTGAPFIAAGTELRKVGEGNGKFVLSHPDGQVVVDASKLTQDPVEVVTIRKRVAQVVNTRVSQSHSKLEHELSQVNAEIQATKIELLNIQKRDALAKAQGRAIHMKTSEDFVRTKLVRLEGRAADLRAQIVGVASSSN